MQGLEKVWLSTVVGFEVSEVLLRDSELKQLGKGIGSIFEEGFFILGVLLSILSEGLVLRKSHIRCQHHERLGGLVFVLNGAVPLLELPLFVEQETEVLVVERGGRMLPRTFKAASILVAPTDGVEARQGDNLLVVEAHAVEDVSKVVGAFVSVWQSSEMMER